MASGNTLWVCSPHSNQPPSSSFATLDTAGDNLVLSFAASVQSSGIFPGILARNYTGTTGVTLRLTWTAAAGAGNVVWACSFERHQSGTTALTGSSFATAVSVTAAAPVANTPQYTDIAFADGAQMNSLLAGESFRLQVMRNGTIGSDTMAGAAQLLRAELRQT